MQTGVRVVEGTAAESREIHRAVTNPIGEVLVLQQKLPRRELDRVSTYAGKRGLRFGEAAVKLGLIARQDVDLALAAQFDYPYLDRGAGGLSPKLVAAFEPFSPKGTAIRLLRSQLERLWFEKGARALAVIGPSGRDGCSYVCANLAVAFSQLGEKTLLIDADLRDPAHHKLFNVDNAMGLSAALVGRVPLESAVIRVPLFRDLSLIPAGVKPPNIYDLYTRPDLGRIVSVLSDQYSVILIDSPAFSANLGAEMIARYCGGALMVIRNGHTRLSDARALAQAVSEVEATLVGSTFTRF